MQNRRPLDPPGASRPARASVPGALAALLAGLLLVSCLGGPGHQPAAGAAPVTPPGTPPVAPPPALLGPSRQLTFEGRRSGEGYFSQDGSLLVFQSEREPGNPFYQIYLMDLKTGRVQRASPGTGKATCAWIHPSGTRLLFSSTWLDPDSARLQDEELALRRRGEARRYAWDFDPHYDIFSVRVPLGDDRPVRLTHAPGYDAEASWSPDGRTIVFSSNRHIYAPDGSFVATLSPEDRAAAALDPSRFVDIYTMDSRGGSVRRLTDTPGYDGGPFFSPDGQRIVFRRFDVDGAHAEIFTMKTDGSDVKQLTHLGAMSWAPFYHPSGDYVIFSSNPEGFDNFELYLVDAEGRSQPVRVTDTPGFDGLPAFSPDGEELVWTRKPPHRDSQLYRATWNDDAARRRLGLVPQSFHDVGPLLPVPAHLSSEIQPGELREFVEALASDATDGRLTGTPGARIATSYVARVFRALGLEPAGDGGTYFQEFGFTAGVSLGPGNRLQANVPGESAARELVLDRDWRPLTFSRVGEIEPAQVVFAGYGLVAPAGDGAPTVDDYAQLDVNDRWVMVLRYLPEGLDEAGRRRLNLASSLRYKAMVARDHGARGILFVSGPASKVHDQLVGLHFDASQSGTSIAVASLSDDAAEALIRAGSSHHLGDLQAALDRGIAQPGFVLDGVRLAGRIDIQQQRKKGRNVLARLPAVASPAATGDHDAPPLPIVLVGAHVDHLGHGEVSGSLAREDEHGQIHPGADDNASGVAALLEVAGYLAGQQAAGKLTNVRDIVFAAWSGEELGLLGSEAWAEEQERRAPHPLAPHPVAAEPGGSAAGPHVPGGVPDLSWRIAAYLNMDMVGRLRDAVSMLGADSSPVWRSEIEQRNVPIGLPVVAVGDTYLPTDATTFYLKKVPILSAFTGSHAEYHTPRDRPELLDYAGMAEIASLVAGITGDLASDPEAPPYVATVAPAHASPRAGLRVYLGTIPDYTNTDPRPGLRLSGVAAGGPAAKAGLQAGDLVIEVDGRKVENIYDYTYALGALKVGEPVEIVVLRGDERTRVRVTPTSRD